MDNTAARMKIREWQGKAKAWSDKSGVDRDYAREAIGTKSGRAVHGLGRKGDALAQSGSTDTNVKIELPENFGKISNFKEMSYSQKLNAVCDWAIRKGQEQNCERFILLDKNMM